MAVNTYYFDGSDVAATDSGSTWSNVTNVDDGDIDTDMTSNSDPSSTVTIQGTNAPSGSTGISQVRARIYGGSSVITTSNTWTVYVDGQGQTLATVSDAITPTEGWSSYTTLSTPTGGWDWTKVQGLETTFVVTSNFLSAVVGVSRIEVEVTSDDPEYYKTSRVSGTINSSGLNRNIIMFSDE